MAEPRKVKTSSRVSASSRSKPEVAAGGRVLDRKHWAARIGVPFGALKNPAFKKLYPFESHLHTIESFNYHYLDEGEGEPVVMVHGNPTWSFFYRKLISGLRDQYRCLVPDHMGCGLSEKPQEYEYTLERHVKNLETWLEETLPPVSWNGGKVNLIVHDWGGPIGLLYAAMHPDRIKRIVVMNTSVFTAGTMPLRIRACRWSLFGEALVRMFNLFAGEATRVTTLKKMPRAVRKGYLLPYNSWNNRVGVYNFVLDIPLESGTRTYDLFRKLEDNIVPLLGDKPMLIQWGAADWCFTKFFLDIWRERFPNAEVDTYEAGHYLMEDAGGQILPRIQSFLKRPCP